MSLREPPSTRDSYRAFRAIPTRWLDNDVYGHVNNVIYYAFFDTAVNQFLIEAGWLDIRHGPVVGLVAETGCRYHSPIAFPDLVTAGLRVSRLGTSSVRYEVGLFRNDAATASADGHFIHVYVDRASGRPVALPDALRQALRPLATDAPA